MELKELTIEKQIEVLKEAKDSYIFFHDCGMCFFIQQSLENLLPCFVRYDELSFYIPTFTLSHLREAYDNNLVNMKYPNRTDYWWDKNDRDSRIAAFDFLINELESKL